MTALLRTADGVLRGRAGLAPGVRSLAPVVLCVVVFAGLYGAAMGLFRGFSGQSGWALQSIYAAAKTPLLLLVTFAVSLPSCFVLSTLLGLRKDFAAVVRALVAGQAGLAITLAALGPLTLLFYASSADYNRALVFNGIMFAIASAVGQTILLGRLRPLIARNPRHRVLLACWGTAYVFVAVQLAWLLRPFVGSRGMEVTFFREGAWDNAYVYVARLVWRAIVGGG